MSTDTPLPRTPFGVLPGVALAAAPVMVLLGSQPSRWFGSGLGELATVALGLLGVALLAAATWIAHRLRTNFEDEILERRTVAVRLGDVPTRWLYLGLLAGAYVSLIVLAVLLPWTAFSLLTALPLVIPAWRVGIGAVLGAMDPVVRDTALVTYLAGAAVGFGQLLGAG